MKVDLSGDKFCAIVAIAFDCCVNCANYFKEKGGAADIICICICICICEAIIITGWSRRGAVSSTKVETLQNAPNSLRPSNELAFTAAPIAIHHFVFYSEQAKQSAKTLNCPERECGPIGIR